jgi:hypothetical protein
MTDPDSGYAGGCVDWSRFDVPTLAGFLDDDLSPMWAQVTALWQIHDLAREHAASLRQARETIVRIWSPAVSQASSAYLDELDALIASRDSLVEASSANAQALAGVLTVLEHAKGTVDDLHEKWRRLGGVTTGQVAAVGVVGLATAATGGAAAGLFGPALDATGNNAEKARLSATAQAVMRDADTAAYAYLPRMVIPSTQMRGDPWRHQSPLDAGSGGDTALPGGHASLRVPAIPPAAPSAMPDVASLAGSTLVSDDLPKYRDTAPAGGVAVPNTPAVSLPDAGPNNPMHGSAWFVDTARGRVLRSGGVIGMAPDQIEVARRSQGQPAEAGRAAGTATEPVGGLWGAGAGTGKPEDRRYRRRFPPETEWPIPRSVPAVLEPSPEREIVHDPGPGVIGIDR